MSSHENLSPTLGLFKKTAFGNIHRGQEGVEETLKILNKLSTLYLVKWTQNNHETSEIMMKIWL